MNANYQKWTPYYISAFGFTAAPQVLELLPMCLAIDPALIQMASEIPIQISVDIMLTFTEVETLVVMQNCKANRVQISPTRGEI